MSAAMNSPKRIPASKPSFATAYGDFATGVLALLALLTVRMRPLFWLFVVMFNLLGAVELVFDYYHAIQVGLPAVAGELGVAYAIPILYVPLLMITHAVGFYLLLSKPLMRDATGVAVWRRSTVRRWRTKSTSRPRRECAGCVRG